jgi:hypothetical protein
VPRWPRDWHARHCHCPSRVVSMIAILRVRRTVTLHRSLGKVSLSDGRTSPGSAWRARELPVTRTRRPPAGAATAGAAAHAAVTACCAFRPGWPGPAGGPCWPPGMIPGRVGHICKGTGSSALCQAARPRSYKGVASEKTSNKYLRYYSAMVTVTSLPVTRTRGRSESRQLQTVLRTNLNNYFGMRRFSFASSAATGL